MYVRRSNPPGRLAGRAASIPTAAAVSVVLLVAAGIAYRSAASAWDKNPNESIALPVPLREIPTQIGGWVGKDVEIEAGTQEYMKTHYADDYVSRRYFCAAEQLVADIYVVYCSTRPSGILGHRPQVCYPNSGWVADGQMQSEFTTQSGRMIECLIDSFHTRPPAYQQVHVLNFYVLNGQTTLSEKAFSSLWDRRPNLSGDLARYVAQVQIRSFSTEYPARALASQIVETILRFLPDQDGHVAAADIRGASVQAPGAVESDK
ncbi:MAG: exosortase-associated EpsI family protein [Phycisphaerales bacterium]